MLLGIAGINIIRQRSGHLNISSARYPNQLLQKMLWVCYMFQNMAGNDEIKTAVAKGHMAGVSTYKIFAGIKF